MDGLGSPRGGVAGAGGERCIAGRRVLSDYGTPYPDEGASWRDRGNDTVLGHARQALGDPQGPQGTWVLRGLRVVPDFRRSRRQEGAGVDLRSLCAPSPSQ